jgi:drug/metabolite transporter (DMT)-like permease
VALLETCNVLLLFAALAFFGKLSELADAVTSDDRRLLTIGVTSALIKAGSSLLFQRALSISPVSLTVPYLSFTPAVLLITSYFMLGEVPEAAGVLGVVIMTAGAYGLNTAGARREDENENAPAGNASKPGRKEKLGRASEDPVVAVTTTARTGSSGEPRSRGNSSADLSSLASAADETRQTRLSGDLKRGNGFGRVDDVGGSGSGLNAKRRSGTVRRGDSFFAALNVGWALPREPGSRLMLLVAVLWSFTSDLDKMGKQACDAFVLFVATQRFCMFVPTICVAARRRGLRAVFSAFSSNVPLLFGVAALEMYTMTAYLMALDHLYVSYAIAAKRSGILVSVVAGALVFHEKIANRLPYVLVILFGMTLVLLAGDDDHDEARAGGR